VREHSKGKKTENPKISEIKKKLENPAMKTRKGFHNCSKWENQSNELRAIIQSKRSEKDTNKNEIKIAIEEPKKHVDNKVFGNVSPVNKNTRPLYSRDNKGFKLYNKKLTQIRYGNHLNDCKQKYKDKKRNIQKGLHRWIYY
jgi:hypothetical protein